MIFLSFIAFQAYQIYASTKGIINDTYIIVFSVKWLEDALILSESSAGHADEG